MAKGILVNSNLLNLHRSMTLGGSLLLAFAGCQNITPQPTASTPAAETVTVRKSPNDHRDYRYLVLQNKLKVLLVSDTKADQAAAALSVYRGSFHEPQDRPGLAHFLEHMRFIGTGKYPEGDSFQQYITANGGSSKA